MNVLIATGYSGDDDQSSLISSRCNGLERPLLMKPMTGIRTRVPPCDMMLPRFRAVEHKRFIIVAGASDSVCLIGEENFSVCQMDDCAFPPMSQNPIASTERVNELNQPYTICSGSWAIDLPSLACQH